MAMFGLTCSSSTTILFAEIDHASPTLQQIESAKEPDKEGTEPFDQWTLDTEVSFLQQKLRSELDHSLVEEDTFTFGVYGQRELHSTQGQWTLRLGLGYQNSDFDYKEGQAVLSVDGWTYLIGTGFRPRQFPRGRLLLTFSQSFLEGRDYEDRLLGTTGLSQDAKMTHTQYGVEIEILIQKMSCPFGIHQLLGHLGYQGREWNMNTGWVTNSEEDLSPDHHARLGLSYNLKRKSQLIQKDLDYNLYGGWMDLGFHMRLQCGAKF